MLEVDSPRQNLRQLCIQLTCADEEGEYGKVLETCGALQKLNPEETCGLPILTCRLTALIHLGKLDEALDLINMHGEEKLGDTTASRAYIYYRQNKNDEALKVLEEANPEDTAALELKGQLFYRLERFKEAYDVYKKLCRDLEDDFDDLRRANLLAVTAQLQQSGQQKVEPSTSELDTYEQLYNQACHLVAADRFDEAQKTLNKAIDTCRQQLTEEGATVEEIDDELTVFLVQEAYILQASGKLSDALEVYKKVQEMKPLDSNVRKVLASNLAPFKNKYLLRRALREQKDHSGRIEHQEIVTGKLRAKRKRKVRLPKNYDPSVKPNPERWLPKQERSTYKSKKLHKKFKDREVGRGTQGASANASVANIDYTANTPKDSPKPSPSPAAPGPRQQKGKKKKGR